MQRLTGLDAGFLYMETPTLLMHTLKVLVLEPRPDRHARLDDLLSGIARRLHLLPPARRRLVEVPLGLHHPLWIEDPAFDLAAHVQRISIEPPGTRQQMDALIADIASRALDRARPLWELWVLEGLEDGALGVLVKIHHAVADGVAATRLLSSVLSSEPTHDAPHLQEPWAPEPLPTALDLVTDALADHARKVAELPSLARATVSGLAALARERRLAKVMTPRPVLDTPRTSFNRAISSNRSFATASFPLADARRVKAAFGVTLNDVVLGVVSGAVRDYLLARGELPDKPLVASVPVSSERDHAEARLSGNRLSNLFLAIPTHLPDPVARLLHVRDVAREAKHQQDVVGRDLMQRWAEYAPPRLYAWAMQQWSKRHAADFFPAPINLVVSNVPGPRAELFTPAHRLSAIYSVGPVLEGIGLNITVWSYVDALHVGVLACREMVPDPHQITAAMTVALAELVERAAARGAPMVSTDSPSPLDAASKRPGT
ncbi:MAG: wax ester/triacylglycerol synthase family O-acyltransferase [Polyangiaceae bacterium]|jgi:diacylglycerol O-acyltransferase|nr:wax ester/triacylglycerol synthase family O-acyltransferase [Polyangiaceae bacterium]MBK8938898.1 wax ester/triacylglycerol synthase family O-acyltransferase [Polyangiaceae bacterium]